MISRGRDEEEKKRNGRGTNGRKRRGGKEREGRGEKERRSGDTGRLNLSLSVEQSLVWPMPVRENVSSLRRLNVVDA